MRGIRRIGKRIVLTLDGDLFLVLHLMIAGRLHWRAIAPKPSVAAKGFAGARRKPLLATFEFSTGMLEFTESATKKRASLHVLQGEDALRAIDPGGIEVFETSLEQFAGAIRRENHTLKRSLTDGRIVSAIGNAYSDEILHRARLSPLKTTSNLNEAEIARLFEAARATLREWTDRLRNETAESFPEKVTAFRDGMAVHGRYRKPCPDCGSPVQRIVYAENETNYCARCQTEGRVLADRSLSRLLKGDWPRRIEELEG